MKFNLLKPKRFFWQGLFSAFVILSPLSSLALTVQEVPNPQEVSGDWVTDMAGILNEDTQAQINQMISDLEAKNGREMAVVTIPQTSPGTSPKEFATQLFNDWGIGKAGQDNGVLFLISVGDRRVEIETGYGVEGILPDAKVGNIIDTHIIPRFKQGDFADGTLAGTKALVVVLASDAQTVGTLPTAEDANSWEPFAALLGGGIFAVIIGSVVYLLIHPQKIHLKPEGRTRRKQGNYIFLCADCQQPMEKVDATRVNPLLTPQENAARNLGSVKFEGWKCLNCSEKTTGQGFHLVALESNTSRFRNCPNCQELIVTRTKKIIKQPTQYSSGKQLIIDKCNHCNYHHERMEKIPRLPPPPPPSSSSGGGGRSGSSRGGGSFGGGRSGGGGGGGSW